MAPRSLAFSTMRSIAWRRASSSNWVYSVTSPWRSDLKPAVKFFATPMLRTTKPNAMPRFSRDGRVRQLHRRRDRQFVVHAHMGESTEQRRRQRGVLLVALAAVERFE